MQEEARAGLHASVREVAIHISNHTVRPGDRGIVVVGGSVDVGDIAHEGGAGKISLLRSLRFAGLSASSSCTIRIA